MGYVPPSYEELPLPTFEQFKKNPEFYEKKLQDYKSKPYFVRHFSLEKLYRFFVGR